MWEKAAEIRSMETFYVETYIYTDEGDKVRGLLCGRNGLYNR